MDHLWTYDLDASWQSLWPLLIDTADMNKRLGLPEMKYVEKNGRLFGTATYSGIKAAWEEVPWQWEYGKGLVSERIYSRGVARYVRVQYVIEEVTPEKTRVHIYFGVIPAGFIQKFLVRISAMQLKSGYGKAFDAIVNELKNKVVKSPPVLSPETLNEKLKSIRDTLLGEKLDPVLVDRVIAYVLGADDDDIFRIRVRGLAREWKVDEKKLLNVFLHGARRGLFTFTWDLLCPHCRGVRSELRNLGDIPEKGICEVCDIDFDATGLNSLEVTFHLHPAVRKVEKRLFCAAEPATKPHILFQRRMPKGESHIIKSQIEEGRYRMRVRGDKKFLLLDVDPGKTTGQIDWRDTDSNETFHVGLHPSLFLKNESDREVTFVVEENKIDRVALRPGDLFALQDFRDLFSEEAVASDVQLDIGTQTILFTDIVGSTKMYEAEGSSVAFAWVRHHFVKCYEAVIRYNGVVVKTIGDALMAAFEHPADAVRASVEIEEYFRPGNNETKLRIRISIHTGPCLAVNLNSSIDYFGSTVNLASKLQVLVEGGQFVFSKDVYEDPPVKKFLAEKSLDVEEVSFRLKWSGEEIKVFRVRVGPEDETY